MANLKPIGSEKLKGEDKIKRIIEIARFNEVLPNSINETSKSEYSITLADNNNYQIVKEKQGYIIKKTISESETEYIEPMKNRKYFSSYSQAFKRLNLLAGELNRLNENEEGVSFFGEQKKFVLKTPKASQETPEMDAVPPVEPPSVPSPELPPSPLGSESPEAPADSEADMMSADAEVETPVGGEEEMDLEMDITEPSKEEVVTFKTIQKLTGKLTQKIRTLENEQGMTSEDIKYVINMVLSSLDLSNLSEEDKEDIMMKFEEVESEEEVSSEMSPGSEDITTDTEVEDIQANMDVPVEPEASESYGAGAIIDSIFSESKVDKVISKYFLVTKKEILENQKKNEIKKTQRLQEFKKQMKEIVALTETVEQELAASKFLEENNSAKIIGKTNKKNLVFEYKGKQVKISPEGFIL